MKLDYSDKYDAYFDLDTDEWTDAACKDAACEFCFNRPLKPSEAIMQESVMIVLNK